MSMIGPDRVARWAKGRMEQEIRGQLPNLDLEEIAAAGVKAIRARVMGVAEQAKELVRAAEKEAAKALRAAGENFKGEAEKEAAKALRGDSLKKRLNW